MYPESTLTDVSHPDIARTSRSTYDSGYTAELAQTPRPRESGSIPTSFVDIWTALLAEEPISDLVNALG
jgi:hypothetical protein